MFKVIASAVSIGAVIGLAAPAKADWVSVQSVGACRTLTLLQGDVGHANIAFWDNSGKLIESRSVEPGKFLVTPATSGDKDTELALGTRCNNAVSRRFLKVSKARRERLQAEITAAGMGCKRYFPIGKVDGPSGCSCVTFATRAWKQATKGEEAWTGQVFPGNFQRFIAEKNGKRRVGYIVKSSLYK
jgi:hypothetical protein